MIAFCYLFFLTCFTFLYILFLYRMLIGLRSVASSQKNLRKIFLEKKEIDLPTVTVILPVRNEEKNIRTCLNSLVAQDYPKEKLQIIIVDDASDDTTICIIEEYVKQDTRIRLLRVKRDQMESGGKKPLITRAINTSRSEIIITTDADCTHHVQWIRSIASPFQDDIAFVSGPVVYGDRSSRFKRMQALEFLSLVGIGAGFIGIGFPRLCNGANIAYRKSIFEKVGGFGKDDSSSSGDDEFLMHKIVHAGHTVLFTPLHESIVTTEPAQSIRHFIEQRKRWASKGKQYVDHRFVAFLVSLFLYFCFLFFSPLIAIYSSIAALFVLFFWCIKWITDAAVIHASSRLFAVPINMFYFIFAEILHVPYIFFISILGSFTSFRWKNRILRK